MVAPPEAPHNARGYKAKAALQDGKKSAAKGSIKAGVLPPSFAAARESHPSRELLQRCYMSLYHG